MRTILIAEDDVPSREMVRTLFELEGFHVIVAETVPEALSQAACHDFDAVLTDYEMPRMNGLELCRALRLQGVERGRETPMWLMSGSITLTSRDALSAGACGLFRKPLKVTEVARAIQRHLDAAAAQPAQPGDSAPARAAIFRVGSPV